MTELTAPMLALLKTEISTDPAGRGYAGHPADVQADLVNSPFTTTSAPGPVGLVDISTSVIVAIIVPTGEMFTIQMLANKALSGQTPPTPEDQATGKAAWSFLKMVDRWATIETSRPDIWADSLATLGVLQSAGVLSAASVAAITKQVVVTPAASVTQHDPRVVEIFMGVEGAPNAVTADNVAGALA
jgi:hypothetical protein